MPLLITILARDTEGSIQFREEYRTLHKRPEGSYTIGAVREKDARFQQWHASFPFRVGHDHPNEVSAYLSGLLLESDHLTALNLDFTAAQPDRLVQTRSAFRKIFRLKALSRPATRTLPGTLRTSWFGNVPCHVDVTLHGESTVPLRCFPKGIRGLRRAIRPYLPPKANE